MPLLKLLKIWSDTFLSKQYCNESMSTDLQLGKIGGFSFKDVSWEYPHNWTKNRNSTMYLVMKWMPFVSRWKDSVFLKTVYKILNILQLPSAQELGIVQKENRYQIDLITA